MSQIKYILVTGGVISGVGKGVISSSFGTLLKCSGFEVTSIKIDPYINLDAGTFSPHEHGEVYVLDDGGEVDLDLGNYERFLDVTLTRDNNITTGKIYQMVIDRERKGEYLGKTVQVIPHITDTIQEWVERVAQIPVSNTGKTPQFCIIELGGTIGDIESMPFVEAFRQFQFRVGRENFMLAHVSLVPKPRATGELKTKPTQASVRELRGLGLSPDVIVCRSEDLIDENVRSKISNFCHVDPRAVLCIPDLQSIYQVPIYMEENGILQFIHTRMNMRMHKNRETKILLKQWLTLSNRVKNLFNVVNICIVGKYIKYQDSYFSLIKALEHASNLVGYKLNVQIIDASFLEEEALVSSPESYYKAWADFVSCEAVVVPGGFGKRGYEGKIAAIKWCREREKPFLGICLGFQAAVVEFSRNVLHLDDATSAECEEDSKNLVIVDMPEHNTGQMGGTMRLGRYKTIFKDNDQNMSKIRTLYGGVSEIEERHRHRYEVNIDYKEKIEEKGMKFVGVDTEEKRMEICELDNHPYFVGTQFHPEYLSRPMAPSPPFIGLVLAATNKLRSYFSRGCRISSRETYRAQSSASAENINQLNRSGVSNLFESVIDSCVSDNEEDENEDTVYAEDPEEISKQTKQLSLNRLDEGSSSAYSSS